MHRLRVHPFPPRMAPIGPRPWAVALVRDPAVAADVAAEVALVAAMAATLAAMAGEVATAEIALARVVEPAMASMGQAV